MSLLIDEDGIVLKTKGRESPLWTLLYNNDVTTFPTDVFRYMFDSCDASTLMPTKKNRDSSEKKKSTIDSFVCYEKPNSLSVACANKNIPADVIELLIKLSPGMVKEEAAKDGCLPLHRLCSNSELTG